MKEKIFYCMLFMVLLALIIWMLSLGYRPHAVIAGGIRCSL